MEKSRSVPLLPNEHLRRERLRCGWTQVDLAGLLGTDGYTVNRWERGRSRPGPYFRQKLCDLFQKNAMELGFVRLPSECADVVSSPVHTISPLFWSLPHLRNPYFTGREEILQTLHTLLSKQQNDAFTQAPALSGMGGVGKTQVAVEYAYRYAQKYSAIFWLIMETPESLMASLQQVANQLQIPERQAEEQAQMAAAVRRWLAANPGWLVIGDNVEDLDLIQQALPPLRQGTLLFTTRRQALGDLAEPVDLHPMNCREGALLILRRARQLSPSLLEATTPRTALSASPAFAEASKLARYLDGLPLALDQAGAYIEETGCSIADYTQRYYNQRQQLLAHRGIRSGTHSDSVATTLRLTIERAERQCPASGDLLRVCAFLPPEAIPEELFAVGASYLGPVLGPVAGNPYQFDLALATLRSTSLIKRHQETKTLSVHRLVQAVLQDQMEPDEACLWRERVIRMINAAFPETTLDARPQCERYLAPALACLTSIMSGNHNFSEADTLLQKTGDYLVERGRYAEAGPLLEWAISLRERRCGHNYPGLISLLMRQAELLWKQGKYQPAEANMHRVLMIGETFWEPENVERAEALNNLALLYSRQGQYEQAESLYQQALHIREHFLHTAPSHLIDTLINLGLLYRRQNKDGQAEPLYQRALLIQKQHLGLDGADLWVMLNNLACLYRDQGKYEQAAPLYQEALRIQEQRVGAGHPAYAILLHNLACMYRDQEKNELAEQLYQQALRIREQQLGFSHPATAVTLHELAIFRRKQGKLDEASSFAQRSLAIRTQALGETHPKTVATRDLCMQLTQASLCIETFSENASLTSPG